MKSYVLAIRDLTKAISIDSTCALAFFNRAVCYHANCNQQKVYSLVLKFASKYLMSVFNFIHLIQQYSTFTNTTAYAGLGCVEFQQDKLFICSQSIILSLLKALQDYGVVLLLTDETLHLKAVINRALLYIEIKDYFNALYDLLIAAELSPFDKKIYHTLGICHHK